MATANNITFNSWRDRLIPASFRGVPFFISDHTYTFGRRTKVYELWGRDTAVVRDYGGKAEYFDIEGYVLQNSNNGFDYWKEKLKLLDALRKRGYGILMHPYLGKLYVSVFEEQTMEETVDEGGIARFTMKFVQNRAPVLTPYALAQSGKVGTQVAKSIGVASDNVVNVMAGPALISGGGSGGRLIASGSAQLYQDSLLDGLKKVLGKMNSALSAVKGAVSSVINTAQDTIATVISTLDQYLDTPCELAAQLNKAADGFLNICGIGADVITDVITGTCSGLQKEEPTILDGTEVPQTLGDSIVSAIITTALDFDDDIFGGLISIQEANARALSDATKIFLLSKAIQVSIATNFLQRNKYECILAKLRAEFDSLLLRLGEYTDTTETYTTTEDMRNTFFTNALNRLTLISNQIVYTVPPKVQTSLQIAYNRYDDLDRDEEIMALNPVTVRHPGFLPQGQNLEILDV